VGELALRFVLGGAIVSVFSAIGEIFEPKTFAGLFGAAPSVALATLTLTYIADGRGAAATSARWMLIASVAMLCYGCGCVALLRRSRVPVWLGTMAAWVAWFAAAAVLWFSLRGVVQQ